jgi:diguanylate cyclase (GGDEF)-like protein
MLNFTKPKKEEFGPNETKFLTTLAQQAAMAVANAKLYQEKLKLSVTDALTGLANRRKLESRLEQELDRAHRFDLLTSVLMVDIDHFKQYNDINGHLLGDRVLEKLAGLLESNTRKVDLVARFGGEEFVVLLPGQDKQTALVIAEKLRAAVERSHFPRMATQPTGHMSITIGVAAYPEDAQTPQELIDACDLALYAAKRSGRNRVILYEKGMQHLAQEKLAESQSRTSRRRRRRRPRSSRPRNETPSRNDGEKIRG